MGLFSKSKNKSMESLTVKDIYVGLESMDKFDAIRLAGKYLVEKGCVGQEYIEGMVEREKITSTYLGEGVAIPHGVGELKKHIKKTGLVVLQFPDGVEFEGEKAHIVVGIAGLGDDHIPILQTIATIMMDEEVLPKLLSSQDKKFIHKTLTSGGDS